MRIGIITQPLYNNYGGILQNWALQQILRKLGHTPYTIRVRTDSDDPLWAIRWLIHDVRCLKDRLRGLDTKFINPIGYYDSPQFAFRRFVSQSIVRTRRYASPPMKAVSDYRLDAVITGSDQVWRPKYNRHIEDQFLGFVKDSRMRKVAYAASFGAADWEYDSSLEETCRPLAQQIHAVSVREQSALELCRRHLGIEAEWVLDPTLLLTHTDYDSICLPRQIAEPYVFAYILDDNDILHRQIEAEAKRRGCRLVYKQADGDVEKGDSIELWLSLIAHADVVFTNSFHGTAFSMIFQRQFVTFVHNGRGSARFDTLRADFPIAHRIIEMGEALPQTDVDYNAVNAVIDRERLRSTDWLRHALAGNPSVG